MMKIGCKCIFVSGGAGFVGSNLCERLLHDGCHVICIDNLYTGSLDNIKTLLDNPKFEFRQIDVVDRDAMDRLRSLHVDEIYHLACPASPVLYQKDAIYTTRVSVEGTLNMLELARYFHCPILYSSTSEVYGNPLTHPQREDYLGNVNPMGPRACYDEGKRCAESLCTDFHRQYGVDVRIIRIFNTYGPKMAIDDGRVISNFIVQALQGKDITVNGNGNQTRSFMYIDDLLEGMVRVMASKYHSPINLGNPEEVSVLDLAHKVLELTKSSSEIKFQTLPQDDPCRRCPDISLARKNLDGWKPKVSLEKGLLKTIDYFSQKI